MDLRSLSTQIVLSCVGLVLLTVTAVGGPAIWLMREQMARQAWGQLGQGTRAAQALYETRRSEIIDAALLAAQRPHLPQLVDGGDRDELSRYLDALRGGMGLDLVVACDTQLREVAAVGRTVGVDLCPDRELIGFEVVQLGSPLQGWLLAARPVAGESPNLGSVIVGIALDDGFASALKDQTGLEHTLLMDGQPVATTFSGSLAEAHSDCRVPRAYSGVGESRGTCTANGRPHYFTRILWEGTELEDEVAIDVSDIVATQRRLVRILVGSIVAVAVAGSGLGVVLARRISRPLDRLTVAAARMGNGDLGLPVSVETEVSELALVAQALESARYDLRRTLSHLREEKAWTDQLLRAIVDGIVTLDSEDRITFFSHGAERITGWSRHQVLNRPCDEVFRSLEGEEPFSQIFPAPGRKHKIVVELAGGQKATLAVTGARFGAPDGGPAEIALVFRDVTEEEAAHRILGHFLGNIAHEFRTPLSALAASTELLLDGASHLSPDELEELLVALHLGVIKLEALVDNLLESASIEAGRFRVFPRPSDLGEIVAEVMRTMQPLLEKRGQRLTVDLPTAIPAVQVDARRIAQVLTNLLSNASKYGPDHANITVGASTGDGHVRVTVADRGPGIPYEYRDSLFTPFVPPSPGSDEAQYGTGLGLWVVKAIVEAHRGRVGVDDRLGGGAVFWFTIPLAEDL